jgi:subtilisin family serine protease
MNTHSSCQPKTHSSGAFFALLLLATRFSSFAEPILPSEPQLSYAAGELLVKFEDGPEGYHASTAHCFVGSSVLRVFAETGWQHIRLPEGMSVEEGLYWYQAVGGILAVEPNYIRRFAATPNDPRFKEQWGLRQIGATNAWNLATGSTNVVVAVIDSGINYEHEDLSANMWHNPGEIPRNGIDDDGNGYVDDVYGIDAYNHDSDPNDDESHGTACAGIIGAMGNNGTGVAGVNWSVQMMALKYGGNTGFGFDANLIECFEYVIAMKKRGVNIRVTNNSYGGDENGQAIKDAIDAAGQAGILNVYSAGNLNQDLDLTPTFPASFDSPSIVSVAASNESDTIASFSNYGSRTVDLAAPGVGISTSSFKSKSAYVSDFTGTSAAAPFVAGAAALLFALDSSQSAASIKAALMGSVDFVRNMTNRVISQGRLNLARAAQNLIDPGAPSFVTSSLPPGNPTPITARVEVTFSKPMNRGSVQSAFSLMPPATGTFAWSNEDRTFSFTPASPLLRATSYTGRIQGGALDASGVSLDGNFNRLTEGTPIDDFTWGFRTSPKNDDFSNSEKISGGAGAVTGENRNATKEPQEPNHASNRGGASVWYRWIAPGTGSVTFDTRETEFDTVLAIYVGNSVNALIPVAANDDDASLTTSRTTFLATAGTNYFVAVDGKVFENAVTDIERDDAPMGSVVLSWYPTPPLIAIRVLGNGQVEISWLTSTTHYVLQVTENLTPPVQWTTLASPVTSDNSTAFRIDSSQGRRFYRLFNE